MGLIATVKEWRRQRVIKQALALGLSVPSRSKIMPAWLPRWIRGDYTLKNSELLFSAVSRISNSLSSMPVKLYRGASPVQNELNDLLSFTPNPNMTSCQFFKTMEVCRDTYGNAYAMKVYDEQQKLTRLDILDPMRVTPIMNTDDGELWYRINPEKGSEYYVHGFYILHIPFISANGYSGINPVSVLFDTLKYADDIKEFSANQLSQGVNAAIVLQAPASLGVQQREQTVKDFMETYRKTSGNILLLESGLTAESLKLSPVDTKLFEVEKITRSKVAMVYNIPPHLLGDYSDTSFSSQEQQMLEYLMLTMLPIVTAYEQELARKLLTQRQRRQGYHIKFDMDAILRADAGTKAEVNYKAIRSAWKTPDEIRYEYNMPPLPNGVGKLALVSQDLATLEYTVRDKPKVLMHQKIPAEQENGTGGEIDGKD